MTDTCTVCSDTLVAAKSRRLGVCARCATIAGRTRIGQLEHRTECPGPQVARFDGVRFAQLVCRACAATAVVPRRVEWREA